VNLNVPGAVTVVSIDDFTRGMDWRRARKADRNMLAQVNPVLDPLLVTPLRNAVVNSAWGRGKIDIPPGIARKLNETSVVTSSAPAAPPFRPDFAKAMRVNTAPDRAKGQKFKVRDERQGRGAPQAVQQAPVQVQPQPPAIDQRGRGQAQREPQRIERASAPPKAERAARPTKPPQAQGERVAAPARAQPQPQPKHERPPQAQGQQKQERAPKANGGPPASPGGGKGKGKKP
jgi:hypothetical protein